MKLAVGIDLGGTTARAALVDENGTIVKAGREVLQDKTPAAVIEKLVSLVQSLDPSAMSLPVGMGVASPIMLRTGVAVVAPNLGWRDVPAGQLLREAFGRPVRLVNDLDAITVGEARCGAGRGERDVICLFLGTGVGMGAICQGLLLEGADGLATELGHIKIASPEQGRPCGCGERGCLEAYTSGRHLPELFAAKVEEGHRSELWRAVAGDTQKLNAKNIEEAALARDSAALALWADIAEKLGLALANTATILNPHVIILGGGVLMRAPSLQQRVIEVVEKYTARPALKMLEVRKSELGDQAGLVGAGLLAHES